MFFTCLTKATGMHKKIGGLASFTPPCFFFWRDAHSTAHTYVRQRAKEAPTPFFMGVKL